MASAATRAPADSAPMPNHRHRPGAAQAAPTSEKFVRKNAWIIPAQPYRIGSSACMPHDSNRDDLSSPNGGKKASDTRHLDRRQQQRGVQRLGQQTGLAGDHADVHFNTSISQYVQASNAAR